MYPSNRRKYGHNGRNGVNQSIRYKYTTTHALGKLQSTCSIYTMAPAFRKIAINLFYVLLSNCHFTFAAYISLQFSIYKHFYIVPLRPSGCRDVTYSRHFRYMGPPLKAHQQFLWVNLRQNTLIRCTGI